MTPDRERPLHPVPAPPRQPTDWWRVFGIVLFTVVAVTGLAVVAAGILVAVAMSSYGSNK